MSGNSVNTRNDEFDVGDNCGVGVDGILDNEGLVDMEGPGGVLAAMFPLDAGVDGGGARF